MRMKWRRCGASSAAPAPTRPAGWGCSPTRRTTDRGRLSLRRGGGGAGPIIPSTIRSPHAHAGRRCAVRRRWSPNTRLAGVDSALHGDGETVTVWVTVLGLVLVLTLV